MTFSMILSRPLTGNSIYGLNHYSKIQQHFDFPFHYEQCMNTKPSILNTDYCHIYISKYIHVGEDNCAHLF